MMSDMTFLSPSPWMNDFSLVKDTLLPENDSTTDLPFDELYSDMNSQDIQSLTDLLPELRAPSTYQDSEISVANSECSDVPSLDTDVNLEETLLQNLSSTDLLSSAINNSNQESCAPESDLLRDVSLTGSDGEEDIWELLSTTKNTAASEPHSKSLDELLSSNIQWSDLSRTEQHQLAEDLSTAVGKLKLGLREQLEVIHIISPESQTSLTDTEFFIDLNCLNDAKLEQVFTFLSHHTSNSSSHQGNMSAKWSKHHEDNKLNDHNNRVHKHSHHRSNTGLDKTCDNTTAWRKSRKNSQKPLASRHRSKTQRKRALQQLKEQQSGLFIKEQVIAVESSEVGELDEVDILT